MLQTIEVPAPYMTLDLKQTLVYLGACASKSEAMRLIVQGAVEINGVKVGRHVTVEDGAILQCGKKFWRRLRTPVRTMTFEVHDFTDRDSEERWLRQTNLSTEVIERCLAEDWN